MFTFLKHKAEIIENTDPNRIFVENVRSFFNVPTSVARVFCEMAVKEKYFRKKIAIRCPNDCCGRIIKSVDKIDENEIVTCFVCEQNEEEQSTFNMKEVKLDIFYQLNK